MKLRQSKKKDIRGKRVLLRSDLDVKVNESGAVDEYHDLRLERIVPTIKALLEMGAKQVVLIGHRGRPRKREAKSSLAPVRCRLEELLTAAGLEEKIVFVLDPATKPEQHSQSKLLMLENLRFFPGEKGKNKKFAQSLAAWGDVYVNDAFGSSHRADASLTLVPKIMGKRFAGPELLREVKNLEKFAKSVKHPFVLVLGGAKISTKLPLIKKFSTKADHILLGGGLANTALCAAGTEIGASLAEEPRSAKSLPKKNLVLPLDVVVQTGANKPIELILKNEIISDIGAKTALEFARYITEAQTVLWNGPMGIFEDPAFAPGTIKIARALATTKAKTLAGGGETLEALEKQGLVDKIDFVSTGGGAMLEFLAGTPMPGLKVLQ